MDIVGRRRQQNDLAGLTLTAVLTNEANRKHHHSRTLFDIIREDKSNKSKKPWKNFKHKIRIRRSGRGSSWKSTVPIPACDVEVEHSGSLTITRTHSNPFSNVPNIEEDSDSDSDSESKEPANSGLSKSKNVMVRGNSIRVSQRQPCRMMVRETVFEDEDTNEDELVKEGEEEVKENIEGGEEEGEGEGEGEDEEENEEMAAMVAKPKEPRVKMSLMSLLEEMGSEYSEEGGEEEEEVEEEEEEDGGGGEYSNCCVCMVRHRGTPFVPCGHTFCRLCSKELYVQKGSCPLCTNYILETLDIF